MQPEDHAKNANGSVIITAARCMVNMMPIMMNMHVMPMVFLNNSMAFISCLSMLVPAGGIEPPTS